MTQSENEPATFRLVERCPNQLRYSVPLLNTCLPKHHRNTFYNNYITICLILVKVYAFPPNNVLCSHPAARAIAEYLDANPRLTASGTDTIP